MRSPGPTSILWVVLAQCCRGGRRRNGAQLLRQISVVFPVIVLLISGWTWRCVVLMPGTGMNEKTATWAATVVVFHMLLLPFLASYLSVVFSNPSGPARHRLCEFSVEEPLVSADGTLEMDEYMRFEEALQTKARALRIRDYGEDGCLPRHCSACSIVKPDRCHHCPICQTCVLKMDHHCPWVNNCVGHGNHKQFMLFLFWGSLELSFTAAAQIRLALPCFSIVPNRMCSTEVFYNHLLTWSLLLCVGAFFSFHVYLILTGRTTFELCMAYFHDAPRASKRFRYDKGWKGNLLEVFGEKWWLWLVPVPNNDGCDGLHWRMLEDDMEAAGEESALRQSSDPRL